MDSGVEPRAGTAAGEGDVINSGSNESMGTTPREIIPDKSFSADSVDIAEHKTSGADVKDINIDEQTLTSLQDGDESSEINKENSCSSKDTVEIPKLYSNDSPNKLQNDINAENMDTSPDKDGTTSSINISIIDKENLESIEKIIVKSIENTSAVEKEESVENIYPIDKENLELTDKITSIGKEKSIENTSAVEKESVENISVIDKENLESVDEVTSIGIEKSIENTFAAEKEESVDNISVIDKENLGSVDEISSIEKEEPVKLSEKSYSEDSIVFTSPLHKSAVLSKSKETKNSSHGSQDIVLKWSDDETNKASPEKVTTVSTRKDEQTKYDEIVTNFDQLTEQSPEKVTTDSTHIDEPTKSDDTVDSPDEKVMNVDQLTEQYPEKFTTDSTRIDEEPKTDSTAEKPDEIPSSKDSSEKISADPTHLDEPTKSNVTLEEPDGILMNVDNDKMSGECHEKVCSGPNQVAVMEVDDDLASNASKSDETVEKSDQAVNISDETLKMPNKVNKSDEKLISDDENPKIDDPIPIDSHSSIADANKIDLDTSGDTVDKLLANLDDLFEDSGESISSTQEKLVVSVPNKNLVRNSKEKAKEEQITPQNSTKSDVKQNTPEKKLDKSETEDSSSKENVSETSHKDTSKAKYDTTSEISSIDDIDINMKSSQSTIKFHEHRLTEPNMMIDIPTQELIDISEADGYLNDSYGTDSDKNLSKSPKQKDKIWDDSICTLVKDLDEQLASGDKKVTAEDKEVKMEVDTETESSKEIESLSKESTTALELGSIQSSAKEMLSLSKESEPVSTYEETVSEKTENFSEVAQTTPSTTKDGDSLLHETLTENETVTSITVSGLNTSNEAEMASTEKESISKETESLPREAEPIQSTSIEPESLSKETESVSNEVELIPSTSKDPEVLSKTLEISDKVSEVPENTLDPVVDITDSLGLLAESSRVMDDDADDPDTPEEDEEDDEDGDPNYDESSNIAEEVSDNQSGDISGDASEDSNDLPKAKLRPEYTYNGDDFTDNDNSMQYDDVQNKTLGFSFSVDNSTSDIDISETTLKGTEHIDTTLDTLSSDRDTSEAQLEATDIDISEVALEAVQSSEKTISDSDRDAKLKSPPKTTEMDTSKSCQPKQTILLSLLAKKSKLTELLSNDTMPKTKKLEMSKPNDFVNIVDLEESSSEDDVQISSETNEESDIVTCVNLPSDIDIDIMSSKRIVSDITTMKGEIIISGVPKPKPSQHKARLNTGEVTIKTSSNSSSDSTLVIPETKIAVTGDSKHKVNSFNLEVFSLDSDSDESAPTKEKDKKSKQKAKSLAKQDKDKRKRKCVNPTCKSGTDVDYCAANFSVLNHFECTKTRGVVCVNCFEDVERRASSLINGIKSFTPLLELDMKEIAPDLVEISDSDSDDEQESAGGEKIGLDAAMELEPQLASLLNETWIKYRMDERLQEAQNAIDEDIARLEKENAEIHRMFDECQLATDKMREELYNTFEPEKKSLQPVIIYDTLDSVFVCPEIVPDITESEPEVKADVKEYETRSSKRKLSSEPDNPSKRAAIPLGYASLDKGKQTVKYETIQPSEAVSNEAKIEEDKDVSVVELSAEVAPPDLPPAGEIVRPALTPALAVFAMRNAFGSWIKARIMDITPKINAQPSSQFTIVRVKFDNKHSKAPYKVLPARCIAYADPAPVRMTIGTRCIALFKDNVSANKRESYYSGVVAEVPNPVNKFRYLVFFDDGYAQYVHHKDTRLVVESSNLVWEEVHPFSREFVREYLLAYPERPMVRLHRGQNIKTEWNGKWWVSKVIDVDASLVHVHFVEDDRTEWIYRGSTRLAPLYLELQSAERTRGRPLPRNRLSRQTNMPYVEYTRSDEKEAEKAEAERTRLVQQRLEQEIRNQRAVAKKSTAPLPPPAPASANLDTVTSRVVYYTPKNAVKPYKMVTHVCSPKCKRTDVLALSDLRTYNPLAKPLLSGWERQLVRFKGHKEVVYRAPCGRRLRDVEDLHKYLRITKSDMGVDLFDFSPATHCLAEFVLNKCIVGKKDLSHGKENVPVPCVNYYDDSLPEFCSYNTERTPTAGVPLNIDPDFLCGCDCTDDCKDKSKCACWRMTLEGARTIGMDPRKVGYVYKRLPEPLPSGIYECNSRCKCKHTCLNRVAQHPLQLKLQVFKTLNRGWGIRALNDVPKGAFLCVYAGNLLTDATANLDGLNEGDEYLAELDYIEVVEQMKEGYEDDIPQKDKKLDKKDSKEVSSEEDELSSSEDDEPSKSEKKDESFQPGYIPQPSGHTVFQKRLRRRDKVKQADDKVNVTDKKDGKSEKEDDCITISDDEELREPSRFTAQAGMGDDKFISKYKSVRALYGKDEACYIMDAKVQGNIGRYLNHSCTPNVFVQNVFVDTHDPRFPWVAFFALSHIKAGTELTWNYNYDVGSVPGKTLYCYCGAVNCRGRLL